MVFIFLEFESAESGLVMINLPHIIYIKENNIENSCTIGTPAGEVLVKHSRSDVVARMQTAMRQANSSLLVSKNMPPMPDLGRN